MYYTPGIEKQLKDARENLPTLLDPNERNKLCKHVNILARKLKNRIAHAKLLAHQRNCINKNVQDVLKVGQVFMQADYVTTYNVYGKPVRNLVLFIIKDTNMIFWSGSMWTIFLQDLIFGVALFPYLIIY